MTSDTFYFENGTLYINDEWIVVCGQSGDPGFSNNWQRSDNGYNTCLQGWYGSPNNGSSRGLSGLGEKNLGGSGGGYQWVGADTEFFGDFGTNGAGGYGCPPGETNKTGQRQGGPGGFSQTRPRAENTGSDTWNGITVENVSHSTGNWGGTNYISYNGKNLSGPGRIGDLLND